ncbi:hypothetical protein [Tardiphaga sp. P9-11]|uniref:hypothetical protein n=1 Tax=Tardiphaga sp. P9-11 TaxID=2024614 RepID=UPI0011F24668|nr:hypothetical protein [Tardiphaga sp. P9-11]KAA0073026.1 hypothetical protein CIW50_22820 [Tardiphaga sp. P9-11]
MIQDFDLSKKSPPTKPKFVRSSILSGMMVALLERNGSGGRGRSEDRRASLLSAGSGGIKSYVVRRLRVILTPIMHRIELRVRSAIEKTGLAANIFDVKTNVAAMQREIESLQETCDQILHRLTAEPPRVAGAVGKASYFANITPLGDGLVGVQTPFGYLVINRSNPALQDFLVDGVSPDRGTISVIQEFLEPGDRFVSIGAGAGVLEMAAARRLGDSGSVIICESNSDSAKAIRVAASINRVGHIVDIRDLASGSIAGRAGASDDKHGNAGRMLDSIFSTGDRIALVKIEMDGGELEVLRALRPVQYDNPQMAVIVKLPSGIIDRSRATAETWLQTVREFGFIACKIDDVNFIARRIHSSDFDHERPMNIFLAQKSSQFLTRLLPDAGQP